MRVVTCLVAAGLAAATTGCVETMDSGYGGSGYSNSGYGNNYYPSSPNYYASSPGYYSPAPAYYSSPAYSRPVVNNYYTTNQPTRYVPVATPAPAPQRQTFAPQQQPQRNADRSRWEGRREGNNTNAGQPQQTTNGGRRGGDQARERDRDGDGQPDRQGRRNRG